jgi:hypothetical protein
MVISGENLVTVIEWKMIQIDYLKIPTTGPGRLNYGSDDESPQSQVKRYFESPQITKLARSDALKFRGHLVIIVGNRKVLCWDVDKDGKLGALELMEQYTE